MTNNEIQFGIRLMELLFSDSVLEKLSSGGNEAAKEAILLRKLMNEPEEQNEDNFKSYRAYLANMWEHIDL